MEDSIYVIEKCICVGIWELFASCYYPNKQLAEEEKDKYLTVLKKYDKNAELRTTPLTHYTTKLQNT